MIPKLLHIVWVGDESKTPHAAINTWKLLNPDYKVTVWNNKSLQRGWRLAQRMRHYWGNFPGVADCMRWEILYELGGIALDADSECVRSLEDWLLEPDLFACWESEISRPGLIANGVVGSVPDHPLIGQIIQDMLDQDPGNLPPWQYSGPVRLTQTVHNHQFRDITIYPSHYFLPQHFAGEMYKGNGQIFATQGWNSTKRVW
jgi:mannosyltransferase OCH1-like enzyme